MKLCGITPPLIALTNSNSPPSIGSISMWQSPNWPAAAGLLLVAAVRLGRLADRLLVGHARRLERDLGPKRSFRRSTTTSTCTCDRPADDLVAGLHVAVQVDRRVLLLQAPQRREDLVLVALGLGLDRERHDGLGQLIAASRSARRARRASRPRASP
jgi:hypothetical protein